MLIALTFFIQMKSPLVPNSEIGGSLIGIHQTIILRNPFMNKEGKTERTSVCV